MTSREIALVQGTFPKIAPIADQAAALFYARLFELDPSLRPLFNGDMREQGRKLMLMLTAAVDSLGNLGPILPVLHELGARHTTYGVRREHYPTVGRALLWTLEKALGRDFTPEVRAAWSTAYQKLSDAMLPPACASAA
jgi:hemoglobin-like flavoprotein